MDAMMPWRGFLGVSFVWLTMHPNLWSSFAIWLVLSLRSAEEHGLSTIPRHHILGTFRCSVISIFLDFFPVGTKPVGKKPDLSHRIVWQNVNTSPPSHFGFKNRQTHITSEDLQCNVIAMNEPNRCWQNAPTADGVHEQFRGHWEKVHPSVACNTIEHIIGRNQVGGSVILSVDDTCDRVHGKGGYDPTGLGRWAWTRHKGPADASVRVVLGHRPCDSKGETTVHSQHKSDDDCLPRDAWFKDLQEDIKKWKEDGDQIILTADINQDMRSTEQVKEAFNKMGMQNLLADMCGEENMPAMHINGTEPINGVWATPGVTIPRGWFLPFGKWILGADHRMGWVDIVLVTMCRTISPAIQTFSVRHLH